MSRNPNDNIDDYLQDFKEKRKLLVRWNLYFPHECVKEFDVTNLLPFFDLFLAE